jgi:hypothetical protein
LKAGRGGGGEGVVQALSRTNIKFANSTTSIQTPFNENGLHPQVIVDDNQTMIITHGEKKCPTHFHENVPHLD